MSDALTQGHPGIQPQTPQTQQQQEPMAVAGVPRLFVGQVPADKQEEDLFPIFSPFGVIEKLSIVRGPENKSRGCAMVEYKKWGDAESAMAGIHGTNPFESGSGRQLVVHFANPRRTAGGSSSPEPAIAPRKLFVGQIPKTSGEDALLEVFSKFGAVEQVNILKSRGVHAGCAFVQFEKWSSCEAAIEALHDKIAMQGCEHRLVVKFADAKRSEAPLGVRRDGNGGPMMNMMGGMMGGPHHLMGGGFDHLSSMGIAAAMGHHHPMALASMQMPGIPGSMGGMGHHHGFPGSSGPMSLGYGRRGGLSSGDGGSSDSLVERGSSADGADGPSLAPLPGGVPSMLTLAHDMTHHHHHHQSPSSHHSMGSTGSLTNLQAAMVMPGMAPFTPYQGMEGGMQMMRGGKMGRGVVDAAAYAHKLFIGQIPFEAAEQDLWPLFSPYGDILELAVLRSQGRSKGCAFLTYATPDQAANAISTLNGRTLGQSVHAKKLVVKYADMKKGL